MPDNFILEAIDLINQTTEDSQCDVLLALEDVYQKQLTLYESTVDHAYMQSIMFMEANSNEPAPIRSQSIISKIVRLIKRIWQQILTMVSTASTRAVVNKLRSYINKASTDKVPSPYELKTLEFYTKLHDELVEVDSSGFDNSPGTFVAQLKSAMTRVDQLKRINPDDASKKLGTIEFVPKESMIKYLDSYQNYLDALKNCAKRVDKYLDKHYKTDGSTVQNYETLTDEDKANGVTGRFTQSELSESDIKLLNSASSILFEELRQEMARLKVKAQHITDQFTKVKDPGIDLIPAITMKEIKNSVQKMLMGAKTNKSTKDYAVVVLDAKSNDPDSQKIIAAYKDVMKSEPNYENVIGIFFTDLKNGNVKNWRVLKSDIVHGDVRKQLGPEGVFIVKN